MRPTLLLLLAITGCETSHDGAPCQLDGDCGSEVCARTGTCAAANTLRAVHVTWTVNGAAPSAGSCAPLDPLQIDFEGTITPGVAFAPVPCTAGLYSIDKLPIDLDQVFLGPASSSFAAQGVIVSGSDGNGNVKLDLR